MSVFQLFLDGLASCMDPLVLLLCALGVFLGAIVGILPGLGPGASIAILLPLIFGKPPLPTIVMLAGIHIGSQFGGAITSIALNVPGESASLPTCFDGYPLMKQGKGGKAMGIAIFSSFFGSTVGTLLLIILANWLAKFALEFGPQEYFMVYVFTFIAIVCIGREEIIKSCIALALGLLICTIGFDPFTSSPRLDFGIVYLWSGVELVPVAVGALGLSEIIISIADNEVIDVKKGSGSFKFKEIFPSLKEMISCIPTQIRCIILGFFTGVLPGAGATIAAMLGYKMEEQIASDKANFGKGSLQGVAAPEAANNACAAGSYVPMFALGIPGSSTSALLLAALIMVGIQPGPGLFSRNPELVWGVISSMYIGVIMLVIMCILLIPLFLWLLRVSQKTLPVIVALLCVAGTFSSQNSFFDVILMLIFTVIGLFFKKLKIPLPPMIIAIVLGKDLELRFMQTMNYFNNDILLIFTRPVCIVLIIMCIAVFAFPVTEGIKRRKEKAQIKNS